MKGIFFAICVVFTISFFSSEIIYAEDLSKAKDLYLTKCAKCHKFYDPSGYDDKKWCQWMEKMRKKAHLDSEEYNLIVIYCDSLRKSAPPSPVENSISPVIKFNDIIPLLK